MLRVPTALLLHTTPAGQHHDWLVGMPNHGMDPQARLWTARVTPPSRCWRELGCFGLTLLDPHRSAYLDYQGPIPGGRGRVVRVDRGVAVVQLWRVGRVVWDIKLRHFEGLIEATQISGQTWRARVMG